MHVVSLLCNDSASEMKLSSSVAFYVQCWQAVILGVGMTSALLMVAAHSGTAGDLVNILNLVSASLTTCKSAGSATLASS